MKVLPRAAYFLVGALQMARSAPWLTAVSALTMAVSLSLIGVFAIALFSGGELVREIGRSLTVSVYLEDGVTGDRIDALEAQIRADRGVTGVRVLTREMDRERNRELLGPDLVQGLDQEALPGQPVIEVSLQGAMSSRADLETITARAREWKSLEGVEDVEFGADDLRLLFSVIDLVRSVGLVLSVALLASALFFVFATIRMAVHSRRDEIEILALVGATPAFIRLPFFISGALQGLAGALVAMLLCGLLHLELEALIRDTKGLNLSWSLLPPGMIAWLLVGGPVLGLLASGVSIGRHIKTS